MLKKSASGVLASFRGSKLRRSAADIGSTGGYFPFAKIYSMGERLHEVRYVPPRLFTRCGLAWDKARLGTPGLGG
ncbi:MAG: hypothetical protein AABY48_04760 [Nitrospirota bacterium]